MASNRTVQRYDTNAPPANLVRSAEYQGRGAFVDDVGFRYHHQFFSCLNEAITKTIVRFENGTGSLSNGLDKLKTLSKSAHKNDGKVIFIGNGGSSAIASHMAVDWTKNGSIRSVAFNDAPTLTCLGNDFGYEEVFAKQLEYYAMDGDIVVIISSSGKSANILRAAEQAFKQGLDLVTFSGMRPTNVLRRKGMISFYTPASDYGLVELAHLALLHSIVSIT